MGKNHKPHVAHVILVAAPVDNATGLRLVICLYGVQCCDLVRHKESKCSCWLYIRDENANPIFVRARNLRNMLSNWLDLRILRRFVWRGTQSLCLTLFLVDVLHHGGSMLLLLTFVIYVVSSFILPRNMWDRELILLITVE
ncbi:unnamed protein product [Malus baccata var. baccata]